MEGLRSLAVPNCPGPRAGGTGSPGKVALVPMEGL